MKIKEWLTPAYINNVLQTSQYYYEFKEELVQILQYEFNILGECECIYEDTNINFSIFLSELNKFEKQYYLLSRQFSIMYDYTFSNENNKQVNETRTVNQGYGGYSSENQDGNYQNNHESHNFTDSTYDVNNAQRIKDYDEFHKSSVNLINEFIDIIKTKLIIQFN